VFLPFFSSAKIGKRKGSQINYVVPACSLLSKRERGGGWLLPLLCAFSKKRGSLKTGGIVILREKGEKGKAKKISAFGVFSSSGRKEGT